MLEGIVQKNDIDIVGCVIGNEVFNSSRAFLVYSDIDIGKLFLHLIGLVSYLSNGGIVPGKDISSGFSFVASRQGCNFQFVF